MGSSPEDWASAVNTQLSRDDVAARQLDQFLSSLPPGYVDETDPQDAAGDWRAISRLLGIVPDTGRGLVPGGASDDRGPDPGVPAGDVGLLAFSPTRARAPGDFRLRRTGRRRVELSSLLAVLESFGLAVVEAVPWRFVFGPEGPEAYVDDIGLRVTTSMAGPGPGSAEFADRLVAAVQAVLAGQAELNILNRLVVEVGLDWQEVNLLCAYCSFRQIVGGQRAADRAEALRHALVAFPTTALAIVNLFRSRLAPGRLTRTGLEVGSEADEEAADADVLAALSAVPDLSHYEALREVVSLVSATPTRSNWPVEGGAFALKFTSAAVPFLPSPRPMAEVFVWSSHFEGLHLRFGRVARGGIRWSDRRSDMRAEVLGLARAQVKKNSLIVPTGAKGAFVLRLDVGAIMAGKDAYRAFIGALLDVTDNMVEGKVAHPDGIYCRDGEDPYLVVAPDKGTASFSDLANALSAERGFWLGDAFASGGSRGYDHKALGITARGAWLSVRRHFRALGMDDQRDDLRVIGVGDMSGDVFGNGMLQSRSVRLLAAFDHRHIFIDPTPRPDGPFEERLRLSRLPGSSWADFDLAVASQGAAVFSRQAKQVELSPEACAALGTVSSSMSPPELVKAVLRAPVDLIFFGGIGTYVKAPGESDAEVDDADNDGVRVSAEQVRARVVVEGANLAVTQRARASYSRRGGRVNGDFVDNAAGVAMSDREVNLKILLGLAGAEGRLDPSGRDEVLSEAEDEAAQAVLAAVEGSLVALDGAAASSAIDFPAYGELMDDLERSGLLDREVEALPALEELSRRRDAGAGLSRPELAVLVAFARSAVARSVEASELVADRALSVCALRYFPAPMRDRFPDLVPSHPLFAQLQASELANEVIHRMGAVWAHEVANETGRPLWEVAGAYWAASEVLDVAGFGVEVDALAPSLSMDAELRLRSIVGGAIGGLARWYLHWHRPVRPAHVIERDGPSRLTLERHLAAAGTGPAQAELTRLGVPAEVAARADAIVAFASVGELAHVADATGRRLGTVREARAVVDAELSLPSLTQTLQAWPALDRWQRWHLHALVDDIANLRAAACVQALRSFPTLGGDEAARQWLAARRPTLARAALLLGQLGSSGPSNLPLAAVLVRALTDAVAERSPGAPDEPEKASNRGIERSL